MTCWLMFVTVRFDLVFFHFMIHTITCYRIQVDHFKDFYFILFKLLYKILALEKAMRQWRQDVKKCERTEAWSCLLPSWWQIGTLRILWGKSGDIFHTGADLTSAKKWWWSNNVLEMSNTVSRFLKMFYVFFSTYSMLCSNIVVSTRQKF